MSDSSAFERAFYPFLGAQPSAAGGASAALLSAVRASTLAKCGEVVALRSELLAECDAEINRAAEAMADRFARGAKLLAFGNGGSATDADDAAIDCLSPPKSRWRSLPALSLVTESATVTALANDVGFEQVFARQLAALGTRVDVALGFSTSGNSANVLAAFAEARRLGMLTVAFSGYDGGDMASAGAVDFCFVVRRQFVPRIQEGHATLWHALLGLTQVALEKRLESVA